ncbi:alpha/beta hydrolase [Psychroflexus aestuariivivens]|uniref:alpha/beta hydrolase n=1 Tax=Psychroflexus aestuariivivens TaxID=1795040 RepID=UPI002939016B|nr:alpha/beta hydrolase [Psychroflexus aestuariivivens]
MSDSNSLLEVYLMPGMAANPTIFEHIDLAKDKYELKWLHWKIPEDEESLTHYAERMATDIDRNKEIVLIGVSFGGVLVQEMSRFLKVKRLIIVSSVKTKNELPFRMKFARNTGIYKFLPTSLLNYMSQIERLPVGNLVKKRIKLYQQYLSVNDKKYLDWAIKEMLCWNQDKPIEGLVHIHGKEDLVFPIKNIENCIAIPGGTHIMIITKFRWFNQNLPKLIEEGKLN